VERPFWTPELHQRWPKKFRTSVCELLMCLRRASGATGVELPQLVVAEVINTLAYPVSQWADPTWLAAQREHQPEHLPQPFPGQLAGGVAGAQGQPAGAGAGGAAGAVPPAGLPGLMGQVFQQLQQVGACIGLELQMSLAVAAAACGGRIRGYWDRRRHSLELHSHCCFP
jgi:hypothetical protein